MDADVIAFRGSDHARRKTEFACAEEIGFVARRKPRFGADAHAARAFAIDVVLDPRDEISQTGC